MLEVPKQYIKNNEIDDYEDKEEEKDAFSIELNSNFENEIAEKFQMSMKDDDDQNPSKSNRMVTSITLIKSQVDLSKVATAVTDEEKYRPMQGQSPYIINCGLQYVNQKSGIGLSILYNKVGRRIFLVGTNGYLNVYEAPRNMLDIQITKNIAKRGEIKLNINDVFNQSANFYQDQNRSKKYEADKDSRIIGIKYGTNVSLSLSYKL